MGQISSLKMNFEKKKQNKLENKNKSTQRVYSNTKVLTAKILTYKICVYLKLKTLSAIIRELF